MLFIALFSCNMIMTGDHLNNYRHFAIEAMMLMLILYLFYNGWRIRGELNAALSIEKMRGEKLTGELYFHIQKQFITWKLSSSEKQVAWLIIKGLPFGNIAEIRGVKEATIRQQAAQIYHKANVRGRAEFTSWFFEDLLLTQMKGDDQSFAATARKKIESDPTLARPGKN